VGHLHIVTGEAITPVLGSVPCSVESLLRISEGVGFPAAFIENPFGFVPLHATEHLLFLIQQRVGDPTFLFRSLELDAEERRNSDSVIHIPLPTGRTGFEAVAGFVQELNRRITGTRFLTAIDDDRLWVLRTTGATEWSDEWSVQQYNLTIVLTGVRRAIGHRLSPVVLRLSCLPDRIALPEELADLPVELARDSFGLAFSLSDLSRTGFRLPGAGRDLPGPDEPDALTAVATLLSRLILSGTTDRLSERAAQAFGMSVRSYRRHLADLGKSHGSLLADARLKLALELLLNADLDVTEIAMELGYAFSGDFTRFFRGRTGLSPSRYRNLVDAGSAEAASSGSVGSGPGPETMVAHRAFPP
jgi:AraC-like DNA-binding protein